MHMIGKLCLYPREKQREEIVLSQGVEEIYEPSEHCHISVRKDY